MVLNFELITYNTIQVNSLGLSYKKSILSFSNVRCLKYFNLAVMLAVARCVLLVLGHVQFVGGTFKSLKLFTFHEEYMVYGLRLSNVLYEFEI